MIVFKEDDVREILKTDVKLLIKEAEKQVLLQHVLTPVLRVNFYILRRKVTGKHAGLFIPGI